MTDPASSDITTQVLIQIRDEMRTMRASFDVRLDALEARLGSVESGIVAMAGRVEGFGSRLKAVEVHMEAERARRADAKKWNAARMSERTLHEQGTPPLPDDGDEALSEPLDSLEHSVYTLGLAIDLLRERIGELAQQGSRVEQTGMHVTNKIDLLQNQMDFLQGRLDALEVRLDSLDDRADERLRDILGRFGLLDADLKKFASVSNAAILHYADETDKVRDRLTRLENHLPLTFPQE